jgi:hypothetical protein
MARPTPPKTPHYRPPPSGPEGRGYESPLGGQTQPFVTNRQLMNENRNRAQSPAEPGRHPNRPAPRERTK